MRLLLRSTPLGKLVLQTYGVLDTPVGSSYFSILVHPREDERTEPKEHTDRDTALLWHEQFIRGWSDRVYKEARERVFPQTALETGNV